MARTPKAPSVAEVVGRNVQELRLELGWTQDQAAARLRLAGLPWARAQLASLETGRRREVGLEELAVLSIVFEVPLKRFLEGNGSVRIGTGAFNLASLRNLVGGSTPGVPDEYEIVTYTGATTPGVTRERVPTSLLYSDAEITAARRLRLTPQQIRSVSQQLWSGRKLDAERERRLDEQGIPVASRSPYRSHVTRQLMAEMMNALGIEPPKPDDVESKFEAREVGTGFHELDAEISRDAEATEDES